MAEDEGTVSSTPLTKPQRARVERNRQKALLLRQARLISRPYQHPHPGSRGSQPTDTGGGFFIEDNVDDVEAEKTRPETTKIVEPPGPLQFVDKLFCNDCLKEFQDSYLFNHFDEPICDSCRKSDEKYELITRTKAKDEFLLKDADLDKREPLLRYIAKRNPHKSSWGDMKLYLYSQVHARALAVWGSEEAMVKQRENIEVNREKTKQKKFDKKIKELRNAVRSSLWRKELGNHEHVYGDEVYSEDDDLYRKTCGECGHTMSYEKM